MTTHSLPARPSYFQDVGDFHAKFDLPRFRTVAPTLLPPDVQEFRSGFLAEEKTEFDDACAARDLEKAADALVDLVYVALGTAHMMGLDFDRHWDAVHGPNMAKERATGADDPRSTRPHALNVVKPAGWVAPNHGPIIELTKREYIYINEQTDVA